MVIVSIETSCDETAVSIIEALGDFPNAKYEILGNGLFSQIDIHREFGGVFPAVAKREHALTIIPMLEKALSEAKLPARDHVALYPEQESELFELLFREEGLAGRLVAFYEKWNTPAIDLIAVTSGPGLEPALWVGVNFAKALAAIWNIPVVPVNHMEGHVLVSMFDGRGLPELAFPALALLISGGHTELILMKEWGTYEKIGQTRDDAVGEAFDKVARMLGLPYPGGPEIGRLAEAARQKGMTSKELLGITLPRPMIDSPDLDFSFSGIKTAVRYALEKIEQTDDAKQAIAREFEDAVTEVLLYKTQKAIEEHGIQSVVIGGGVVANTYIRNSFKEFLNSYDTDIELHVPEQKLSTDNSVMIALAGHAHAKNALSPTDAKADIRADGNRSLAEEK